jgi:hypothetical protein
MLNRISRYLDPWRFGVLATGIHHFLFFLAEKDWRFEAFRIFDYLDALPYHFLNSIAFIWEIKADQPYHPLWLEQYEWGRRGLCSWVLFIVLSSIQWFILGAALGKATTLWRRGELARRYLVEPLFKLFMGIILSYLLWYSWITAYSNRWYLQRMPINNYELCGIINTRFPAPHQVDTWKSKENATRISFFSAYQRGSEARIATIVYPEEYVPYEEWLFIGKAARRSKMITIVSNRLESVRFRDFLFKGWTDSRTYEFEDMKLLSYPEAREMYDQFRNYGYNNTGVFCYINANAFLYDGNDRLYLAIYRKDAEGRRMAEIY